MPDIETVGQYAERRELLQKLANRRQPILHYEYILLDRLETFQQTPPQIQAVEQEARANGFVEIENAFNIVILKRVGSE
jgi:hypothetical protein